MLPVKIPETLNRCLLAQEMEIFFGQEKYTDVEIEVGNQVLRAHKSILASRSPVFNGMFLNDFLEAKNSRVIMNFDYETTFELLRFIYCEKVLNLDELACNLLEAADQVIWLTNLEIREKSEEYWRIPFSFQYLLSDLMDICDKSLQENLTVDNILKILIVADLHDRKSLMEKTIQFLGRYKEFSKFS